MLSTLMPQRPGFLAWLLSDFEAYLKKIQVTVERENAAARRTKKLTAPIWMKAAMHPMNAHIITTEWTAEAWSMPLLRSFR